MSQLRNFLFTGWMQDPPLFNHERMRYLVFQREKCPETGKLHWQGYCEMLNPIRINGIKQLFGDNTMHIERRKGTPAQAIAYCKKEESYVDCRQEFGMPSKQGARTDIEGLKQRALAGEKLPTLLMDCPNYNIMRMCEKIAGMAPVSHEYKPRKVVWIYGKTGTGKTREAMQACPAEDTWHGTTGQWFDGYWGQGHAIIDELRAKNWSYDLMLRLLDGYEMRVPIKGGFTIWRPHTIYITTPFSPEATYGGQLEYHGSIDQLLRRLTHVKNLSPTTLYPVFGSDGQTVGCTVVQPEEMQLDSD